MTLILSLLGLGGIASVAVWFLIPGVAPFVLRLLDKLPPWLVYGLAAALVCGLGVIWYHHAIDKAFAAGEAKADAKWTAAQKLAEAKQARADQDNLGGQLAGNLKLDQTHDTLEAARRTAVDAYIADHRLRPEIAGSASCRANQAGVHRDPGSAAGTAPAADMVAIRPDELDQLTAKAMRDTEGQLFLQGLVDQGLAVRASEVPG